MLSREALGEITAITLDLAGEPPLARAKALAPYNPRRQTPAKLSASSPVEGSGKLGPEVAHVNGGATAATAHIALVELTSVESAPRPQTSWARLSPR